MIRVTVTPSIQKSWNTYLCMYIYIPLLYYIHYIIYITPPSLYTCKGSMWKSLKQKAYLRVRVPIQGDDWVNVRVWRESQAAHVSDKGRIYLGNLEPIIVFILRSTAPSRNRLLFHEKARTEKPLSADISYKNFLTFLQLSTPDWTLNITLSENGSSWICIIVLYK